jgi:outer membrane receptor protein involved in Fe transport
MLIRLKGPRGRDVAGPSRRIIRRVVKLSFALVCGLVLCPGRSATQTTSTITGAVTDAQKLAVAGADVRLEETATAVKRNTVTDGDGVYHFPAVPAGIYTIAVAKTGFTTRVFKDLEVTLNRTLTFNVQLEVGGITQVAEVSTELPLLETTSSSQGATIVPREIVDMPINGRNYLDLMQLVPGVYINRSADANSDNATAVLGERGGNTSFLIDGLPNRNEVSGGAAAQFNQETIAEFQVLTTGYTAEFGHASGGIVNVITKSGTNEIHGLASGFHRNNAFDSSNTAAGDAPYLLRWDYSLALGGPVIRDKFFWFASGEGIHERRQLNFQFPGPTPDIVRNQELAYDTPSTDRQTRFFGKLNQVLGAHHLTEQFNYANSHQANTLPLSQSTSLPSTRQNYGARSLLLGFTDTATLGSSVSPFVLSLRGSYRRDPSSISPAHPNAGPYTIFNMFSGYETGGVFGDITPQITFGSITTRSNLDQQYAIFGASLAKTMAQHTLKFGWDFERTQVDGTEASLLTNQLFATLDDYATFGPINSGFFTVYTIGGETPEANKIRLRNDYNGLFVQDDWKLTQKLTINAGLRWDYDSEFKDKKQFSPRLGFAWSVTPKTVVRGSWGYFYDHFRLGIARDVPAFGGADLRSLQPFSYPRLFYGVPTIAPALFGLCLSPTQTDAQLAASGATCPYGPMPIYGVDHLNNVVAPGHAPIPTNSVVNASNIEQLSGMSSQQWLDAASGAIGQGPNFLFWGAFGALAYPIISPANFPVTLDPSFSTPYTRGFTIGVQRQIGNDWAVAGDYHHKAIKNILGVRVTNVPFEARIDNSFVDTFVNGFGPWYSGTYDAAVFSLSKRPTRGFTFGASYTFVSEHDNALCSGLDSTLTGTCYPTDSFRGVPTVVTDPGGPGCPGGATNATNSFIACNGNYVPVAGRFYNGADLDNGPSDLALRNTFEFHGLLTLPWKIELSGIMRAQSGYPYAQVALVPVDQDGNGNYGGRDLKTARNQFRAPMFFNTDVRIAKSFMLGERVRLQALFEFFNIFNNGNPAAVQTNENTDPPDPSAVPFGKITQRLPGREGQVGLRIEF